MPQLGDVFINLIYSENPSKKVKATEHPVEEGVNITDHVEREALSMGVSGIITGPDASIRKKKLIQYMDSGELLKYSYRNQLSDVIILDFSETHDVDATGGFKFSMSLRQVRIAKPSVLSKPKQTGSVGNKGQQQPKGNAPAKVYVVKKGDNLTKIGRNMKPPVTWQALYNKNRNVVGNNPNLIYPGQRLVIPS